ncbi:MAG: HAD family hydrolase [Planctomycetales bacterium]|nr:HAD family hydrolase [Planctomycetales bacterium]
MSEPTNFAPATSGSPNASGSPGSIASESPPAALLIELCGVLYDDSCWRRWMLQLLTRMGVSTQYAAFYQTWEQEHFGRVCAGEMDYWQGMRAFLRSVGMPPGLLNEACAAGQSRRKQWERSIRPLPTVVDTLRLLQQSDVPVAVIAHASFSRQTAQRKLRELGLIRHVTGGVHATADLGKAGRFGSRFRVATECLSLPPERIVYVGCGRLAIEQALDDGLRCFGFNTDLTTLPCELLDNFASLGELCALPARRLAG